MSLLSAAEIRRIERKFPAGVGSVAAVEVFKQKGERFSEATLRKYVQLGLLPKSRRVGTRGRHRGSSGLYPTMIIPLINEIKRSLEAGSTLVEIRVGRVGLVGEVNTLQQASHQALERFQEAISAKGKPQRAALRKMINKHRSALNGQIRSLTRLATKIDKYGNRMGHGP